MISAIFRLESVRDRTHPASHNNNKHLRPTLDFFSKMVPRTVYMYEVHIYIYIYTYEYPFVVRQKLSIYSDHKALENVAKVGRRNTCLPR